MPAPAEPSGPLFADRAAAGAQLGERVAGLLAEWAAQWPAAVPGPGPADPSAPTAATTIVLGLPRGGVPVAAAVAGALGARLDVIVVRKLSPPGEPELAMGAVGESGALVVNDRIVRECGIGEAELAAAIEVARAEVAATAQRLRPGRPPPGLAGAVAVVVDDGIATGATAEAACRVARVRGASRVVLAVPVAPAAAAERLRGDAADLVVCLATPARFWAVGQFYRQFAATPWSEVTGLLAARW